MPGKVVSLPDDVFKSILRSGQFASEMPPESLREQAEADLLASLIQNYLRIAGDFRTAAPEHLEAGTYQSVALLGLVPLLLSVAMWGIAPADWLPEDPGAAQAHGKWISCNWAGTQTGRGKHLRSVRDGGIGIPHLDTGELAQFLEWVLRDGGVLEPGDASVVSTIRDQLRHDETYDTIQAGQHWMHFQRIMERVLVTEAAQRQILTTWLTTNWLKSYTATMVRGGTVIDALVNVRIYNSSSLLALGCALPHALAEVTPEARVNAQLRAYVTQAPGEKSRDNPCAYGRPSYADRRRPSFMLRPVFVFLAVAGKLTATGGWHELARAWMANDAWTQS